MLVSKRPAVLGLLTLMLVISSGPVLAQGAGGLRVQADASLGPHYVGQGFELQLSVVASGKAPKVEPPRLPGARVWLMGIESEPITTTGIGAMVTRQSRFVIRLSVVAERPGTLEIPAILVKFETRVSRSRALRLRIQPIPLDGRPAEFLGGVGRFVLETEAVPGVVRVGQELEFRIKVAGPAAWGMKERPDLARFNRLPLGLRIEAGDVVATDQPPARTFIYRLRPTKPGEATLPPVVIAAFDPTVSRFVTHKTRGVPIRVVAVPSFDSASIDGFALAGPGGPSAWVAWITWVLSALFLLASFAALSRVRRRLRRRSPFGPEAARRYAARLAERLFGEREPRGAPWKPRWGRASVIGPRPDRHEAARRVCHELTTYLGIGIARPPGALTPDEAKDGVVRLTGCEDLGSTASELTTECDRVLYGEANGQTDDRDLLDKARGLFTALGRVKLGRESAS
jgi:hypothetical protein